MSGTNTSPPLRLTIDFCVTFLTTTTPYMHTTTQDVDLRPVHPRVRHQFPRVAAEHHLVHHKGVLLLVPEVGQEGAEGDLQEAHLLAAFARHRQEPHPLQPGERRLVHQELAVAERLLQATRLPQVLVRHQSSGRLQGVPHPLPKLLKQTSNQK